MRKPRLNIDRLKKKREEKGWANNYAAEEMNLAPSGYFRYESGEAAPSYSVIRNMALTLGTSVEYLTDKTDNDSPNEIVICCRDPRLTYIIERYSKYSDEDKTRLYKYAQKIPDSLNK